MKKFIFVLLITFLPDFVFGNYMETFQKQAPVDSCVNLKVKNLIGKISIIGRDSDEILIKGEKGTDVENFVEAFILLENTEIFIEKEGETLQIQTILPKSLSTLHSQDSTSSRSQIFMEDRFITITGNQQEGIGLWVDYRIYVNREMNLQIESNTGEIWISGIHGNIEVYNANGDIEISQTKGAIFAESFSGGIFLNEAIGTVTARSNMGKIFVNGFLGKALELQTTSGNMDIQLDSLGSCYFQTLRGDINLNISKGSGGLLGETIYGNIIFDGESYKKLEGKFDESQDAQIQFFSNEGDIFLDVTDTFFVKLDTSKKETEFIATDKMSFVQDSIVEIKDAFIGILEENQNVILRKGEKINGAGILIGGKLLLSGKIKGNAYIIGGEVEMNCGAKVEGDLILINSRVKNREFAKIDGKIQEYRKGKISEVIIYENVLQKNISGDDKNLQGSYIRKIHKFKDLDF